MNLVVISILVTLVSCTIVGYLVWRRAGVLASIDVESLPEERERKLMSRLLADRFRRKIHTAKKIASVAGGPLTSIKKTIGSPFSKGYQGLLDIRERQKRASVIGGASVSGEQEGEGRVSSGMASTLADEGYAFLEEEEYDDAEKKFIDAIAVDKKHVGAYDGLAEVYCLQKEWRQAKEVLAYICKLERDQLADVGEDGGELPHRFAMHLHDYAEVLGELGDHQGYLKAVEEALVLDPHNPKLLHGLVEVHISLKQRLRAERAFEKLRRANPDDNLEELEAQIAKLKY